MSIISRQPDRETSEKFDLIIIGGGIYGTMLLLEAVCRQQRVLLLEKNDFGGATSYNSLRIIHGGLRYLQTLDLVRFRESVKERHWFLQTFPDLVKPLPCLMPLYNRGAKRPEILRIALWMNDQLSADRNGNANDTQMIKNGQILNTVETANIFPGVETKGLTGSALWYDAHMPDSHRVIIETLRWACSLGAKALNYMQVDELLTQGKTVTGVRATDIESGQKLEFQSNTVINAAGPWARELATNWDRDIPDLFRPSLLWNVLFDRPTPSSHALALTPNKPGGHTYFLRPWQGKLLAGTGHAAWTEPANGPQTKKVLLEQFIKDLNSVLPGMELTLDNVVRVYAGFLPVTQDGGTQLTKRPMIIDHGRNQGPKGLFSVTGIKFTTARKVAEQTLDQVLNKYKFNNDSTSIYKNRPKAQGAVTNFNYNWLPNPDDTTWLSDLEKLISRESVLHLDDLLLRRTNIGDNPERTIKLASLISTLFNWTEPRKKEEISKLTSDRNW